MSILLEALRKSEKSKRPVEPPGIHTEQQAAEDSEPVGKGPVALLLLLALLLITWLVWRQYQPPAVGYQPPVTLPANRGGTITTPVASLQTRDSVADAGKTVKHTSNEQRTPVEVYRQADSGSGRLGDSKPVADSSALKRTNKSADIARPAPVQRPTGKVRVTNKYPAPISYWELPDGVRADVPEMRFSVLVYADRPADRFVLINGQRLQEGDSYQQGPVVKEIRRDGVVFSYQLYQFLVER